MGKHFDRLVSMLNKGEFNGKSGYLTKDVESYLERLVSECCLFEFPMHPEEVFPKSGKNCQEYDNYLKDYLRMSEEYGTNLITPFELTAIEDLESVVLVEKMGGSRYRVACCQEDELMGSINWMLIIGDVLLRESVDFGLDCDVSPDYFGFNINGKRMDMEMYVLERRLGNDIVSNLVSYIEELVYIMDPENFIIEKESYQSRDVTKRAAKKKGNKKVKKQRNTIMRPHYMVLSTEDTSSFLRRKSDVPRVMHPVRGHWRRLISERYTNKRGQMVFVRQHYRGTGEIDGNDGWRYRVMVKEDPTSLKPYQE